ncbi:MAG: 3-oxoacyl-[acyl-carrier-protein] synthase III C-terminal domain-containing protein [Candidatus Sericytochromatia bacterium]
MGNRVKIVSMGKYLPERVVKAEDFEKEHGIDEGFSINMSGVAERHFANEKETCSYMGARALEKALEKAGMKYEDLDVIVGASGSYDHPIPYNACLIQKEMGKEESGTPCWDVDSTCLSFVTAFDVVSYMIEAGRYKNVAIVSSEIASKSLNPKERESATLLGDGAVAMILTKTPENEPSMIIASEMQTFSKGAFHTSVKGGGNVIHPNDPNSNPEDFTFNMKGRAILEMSFELIPKFLEKLFTQAQVHPKMLDLFVPHQASKFALLKGKELLCMIGMKESAFVDVLEKHGNCIAASIPIALHDALEEGKVERGGKVALVGTAAGLSLGGIILVY